MGVLGVIYYLKMFRTNALYHHSGSDSCSPKRFIRGLFFFPLACVMVIAICSFYTLVYDRRRLADSADVNNRHRRLIEDVEIECMQAIDFFQKNYFATMEPSDIGDRAVDLWLKTHPESELANGWENYENVKLHDLVTKCAWRAWVFSTGGASDTQFDRQHRWRSFDWLEFQKHEAELASHGKRMPIFDDSHDSQNPSEADIRGNMPLLQRCGAEPACRFRQEYIANGKIYGRKALPKGDPDTTDRYCDTCECTGAVSRPPWSAGTLPADSPKSTGSNSTMGDDIMDF